MVAPTFKSDNKKPKWGQLIKLIQATDRIPWCYQCVSFLLFWGTFFPPFELRAHRVKGYNNCIITDHNDIILHLYNQSHVLQALNCLITWSIGALQIGQGSPLCFKTCAQAQQQQQCPVSPWITVAFLGCSMQIMHFELSSVSSGKATALPLSVVNVWGTSSSEEGDRWFLVTQGFSSGWRLKLNPGAKKHKELVSQMCIIPF